LLCKVMEQNHLNLDIRIAIDGPNDVTTREDQDAFLNWLELQRTEVEIIRNKVNLGLKRQILSTLNSISSKYDGFIVLEEDLVISNFLIEEFYRRLEFFKNEGRIWSINAYTNSEMRNSTDFLTSYVTSWGWATWSDRWLKIDTDADHIISSVKSWSKFNFGNAYDYKLQLYWNKFKIRETWAVFWYATIYINGGSVLQIGTNHIENNGFNSGENFSKGDSTFYASIDQYADTFEELPVHRSEDLAMNMFTILNKNWKFKLWRTYQWIKLIWKARRLQ